MKTLMKAKPKAAAKAPIAPTKPVDDSVDLDDEELQPRQPYQNIDTENGGGKGDYEQDSD